MIQNWGRAHCTRKDVTKQLMSLALVPLLPLYLYSYSLQLRMTTHFNFKPFMFDWL